MRDDRILAHPVGIELHHLGRALAGFIALLEDVFAIGKQLARRRVQRNRNLLARLVAGLLDGFENHLDRFGIGLERGSKAALVADRGVVTLLLQHRLQGMKCLGSPAQRLGE